MSGAHAKTQAGAAKGQRTCAFRFKCRAERRNGPACFTLKSSNFLDSFRISGSRSGDGWPAVAASKLRDLIQRLSVKVEAREELWNNPPELHSKLTDLLQIHTGPLALLHTNGKGISSPALPLKRRTTRSDPSDQCQHRVYFHFWRKWAPALWGRGTVLSLTGSAKV